MKEIQKTDSFFKIFSRTFLFRKAALELRSDVFYSPECTCWLFEAGEKIYTRENYRRSMGIVLSGKLRAVKNTLSGSAVVMNAFFAGGVFGVAGLFHPVRRYVSEIESVSRSRVLFLPQSLLHRLFLREPAAAENYIAFLSDRICFLNSCIDSYTGGPAKNRLLAFLLSLPTVSSDPPAVELPYSMTRLADSLGIGRASLYRAFDGLIRDGTVRRDGKKIILCRRNGTLSGSSLFPGNGNG